MRDRLPSGSTTNNNGTPCRVSPLITARRHPSKGCRLRVMTTEVGKSWEWVVCGVFVRQCPARSAVGEGGRTGDDGDVMHLLKVMLKANGKQGVPQGGVISPLLSNLYLTEVDRMLERAKEATRYGSTPASNMRGSLTIW